MANIIIKNYNHYNRSLGKHIKDKAHYKSEMARRGFVSFEEGQRAADKARERKNYHLSPKARAVIETAALNSDSKGNLRASDNLIDGMKEVGVRFDKISEAKELDGK